MAMLTVENINVYYGVIHALKDISFHGNRRRDRRTDRRKRCRQNHHPADCQRHAERKVRSIRFQDHEISRMPEHKIVKQGISHVPEGRRMFSI